MPFIGQKSDGELVGPRDVGDQPIVEFPGCGGKLKIRTQHRNTTRRPPLTYKQKRL